MKYWYVVECKGDVEIVQLPPSRQVGKRFDLAGELGYALILARYDRHDQAIQYRDLARKAIQEKG